MLLRARYEVLVELGPDVARARDRLGGGVVIVKRAVAGPAREALERELHLLLDLDEGPASRAVLAVVEHDEGALTAVFEDVAGVPLDRARPSATVARSCALELLSGLLSLHARGVVHGDLKPAHVLVDRGTVRLLDLGLATPLGESARGGTHDFLAPELLAGAPTSAQTDLYAFGRTLERSDFLGLDARLDALVRACLSTDPSARPPSLEAAIAALGALPRRPSAAHEHDPLAPALDSVARALDANDGRTLVLDVPRGGRRSHLAVAAIHRALARRRTTRLELLGTDASLAAAAPLFDTPHTDERERLVERTWTRSVDAGVGWLVDGADEANVDLRADLVTAARTSFVLGKGVLVIVGADEALLAALSKVAPSLAKLVVPKVDDAELARTLDVAGVALDASGRSELLARAGGRRGAIHRSIRALARGELSFEEAIRLSVADINPLPHSDPSERRAVALRARADDAPRAALRALASDDDDDALRLAAWAHARVGAIGDASVAIDRIAPPRRTAVDRADRARLLERLGRFDEALEETRALLADASPADDALMVSLLVTGATSALRLGRLDEARALTERATTVEPIARVRIDAIASDVALARGERGNATHHAERALRGAEALDDRGLLALVEARLGAIAGLGGDPGRALEHHTRALEHAEAAGDLSALPPYLGNVASAHHVLGHVDLAIATYERAATLAERLGRTASLATTLVNLAGLHQLLRAHEEATALLDRAADVAERAGAAPVQAQVELIRAEVAHDRSDPSSARRHALVARGAFDALGATRQVLEVSILLAEIELSEGRGRAIDTEGPTLREAGLEARAALVHAELALRAHRSSEACALADDAAEKARKARQPEQELRASAFLARAHAALGTGAAEAHAATFRRRLGDLAARTPNGLRERFVRRWTESAGIEEPRPRTNGAPPSREGLGVVGQRLVSLVRRTLLEADESRLLEAALDEAIAASGAERAFLLLAREGRRAEVAVARNLDRDTIKRPRFRMSRSVADRVLATNEPLVTASASEDPELAGSRSILDLGLRSIVCVPVRSPSGVVGALYLDHRFERGRFDAEVAETAQAFADVVGLAIENARLHRASEARWREAESSRAAAEERASQHLLEADRMAAMLASRASEPTDAPGGIVGRAPQVRAAIELVQKVARSDLALVIEGESGTGKELFARLAHDESPRRSGPFLAINCGAMPEPLLESELFGHVRGAFTGATRDHAGLLRSASGGTVFLDEIGEMPASMQVRLLRALQEREVRPVGGRAAVAIDVRVVSATHRHLPDEIERGRFRRDLYFRLAGVSVTLPPLRERASDIPLLARSILDGLSPHRRLSRRAVATLLAHTFPGNVRELEQALRRACAIAESDTIEPDDLGLASAERAIARERVTLTSRRVAHALGEADGNRTAAARALGVSRATLHRFLAAHPPEAPGRRGRPRL